MSRMNNNYLYYTNIDNLDDCSFNQSLDLISEYRLNKINKYINIKDKKLSLCSELLLRRAFNDLCINSGFDFKHGDNNKPYIDKCDVKYNISHSGNYAICAISIDEIGVDIEEIRECKNDIARACFSCKEIELLNSIDDTNERLHTFYRLWTLKESFIKNIGIGLYLPLNTFTVMLDKEISIIQDYDNNKYYFEEINIDPKYKCSVCKLNNKSTCVKWIDVIDLVK